MGAGETATVPFAGPPASAPPGRRAPGSPPDAGTAAIAVAAGALEPPAGFELRPPASVGCFATATTAAPTPTSLLAAPPTSPRPGAGHSSGAFNETSGTKATNAATIKTVPSRDPAI